ncbi:NADPH:quinone reductase and related Zn-dependent oxidoreductase [Amycolatopsis mediterranei S699]|uniref:NADPH:quinone reductase and related Zn-dependent oxidoreductase n=3 Tax=Amycolatopsis mediterranei TaxID=33910 RepID=A0A0H3DDV7_AMYMU|nr:NADPH:quinone oxidoreductase family protein [Amycolatopsis mediterranei]ADJ48881.1 NADPH:quinone reductase and related Zn-dependent oxidoreductase [Amycolatopsis mediterranei U32]AEK45829.1 NADPH:quinone reductase and related Zn-dependent oxidoreductase [Amycolatopsis mediterranei S699]AFO80589.1 NADPH:quinone reductase and related Zn-dependent oxidoreductase [Amycolatopsis mediterranei S699]AGT87717.1 NADPH:quinone reductase-related Zn-dependent oxidoreductase [Amycolatopsis mediterranei RB
MKAAWCVEYGPPSGISVAELDEPEPGTGEVLVRVHAAAVNYPDVLIAANHYQVSAPLPFTPGSEFAGVVTALGAGVTGPAVGSPVAGAVLSGAFAEQVVAPVEALRPIPDGLDMVHAAAFHVTYTTAYHALVTIGGATAGEWVAVLGASGGVGSAVVDVATRLGLHVVAAASSEQRLAVARKLGAEAGIDYLREDLKTRIRELTGGAHLVIDPVGGDHAEAALRALRRAGRFVTVGFADGAIPRIPLNLVLLKNLVVRGFEARMIRHEDPEATLAAERALAGMVRDGMRPLVSRVHPLSDVAGALTAVAERRTTGKIVLEMAAR